MHERIMRYEIPKHAVDRTVELLEKDRFFISDIVEHDMKSKHPNLYRYIDLESKGYPSTFFYKLGAGVGYCLFGNPTIHKRHIKINEIDMGLLVVNVEELTQDFGDITKIAREMLCLNGELRQAIGRHVDLTGNKRGEFSVLSGITASSLPFISKIQSQGFSKRFGRVK